MSTYERCPKKVVDLIRKVMVKHQPHLKAAGVQVAALFAYAPRDKNDNHKGSAIKHGGYAAAAVIRPAPPKLRALGVGDAVLIIDGDHWIEWSEAGRAALIDHELEHLEVVWDVMPNSETGYEGLPQLDDLNRPKIRTRLHDWQLGGFDAVVKRHGEAAFEARNIRSLVDDFGQTLFPFMHAPEVAGRVA